ncbi:FAD-dependent oxidoreductase [Almyronema epifaneia]|uniref:FAD-dependent oxidoreductase n=1 Tax=Almyronema epifaneia S1 TaxID=2991925 RepID=A0ABW6ID08_9CYAN
MHQQSPLSPSQRRLARRRRAHLRRQRRLSQMKRWGRFSISGVLLLAIATSLLEAFSAARSQPESSLLLQPQFQKTLRDQEVGSKVSELIGANGRPQLSPLPIAQEVWECEVVVVGGSLGGVAAASHAMNSGARTCLIELTPWLGGQISSQGVSAIDESRSMRARRNFSASWNAFKDLILQQVVDLPTWTRLAPARVSELNSCWVGELCFPPKAGAAAAQSWLQTKASKAPGSRWGTSIAFKGAAFDITGRNITAVYAVKRIPKALDYVPHGRLSRELVSWYSWSPDETFEKVPIRLQAPPGKELIVIDATDTGELVGWAKIPHATGSDARSLTKEINAPEQGNPYCTQGYTFPFALAIFNDGGGSLKLLERVQPGYSREEHQRWFAMEGFPMFDRGSLFNYRRIVSTSYSDPMKGPSSPGDISLINWNRGNDWVWMDPPLILTDEKIDASGQRQNWLGGLDLDSLREGENHALLFSEWLIKQQSARNLPLAHLAGPDSPLGTYSGLSMYPYIREGRRILGRTAYQQPMFMMLESDIREDLSVGRNFEPTAIALTHYDVDIHGCRYRNQEETGEAAGASVKEFVVRPVQLPLESLIPQGVDNLLIGGKAIAVSHIVNAVTRVHYGEWSAGAAAGATAGWLVSTGESDLKAADIVAQNRIAELQAHLQSQGLRFDW